VTQFISLAKTDSGGKARVSGSKEETEQARDSEIISVRD